MLSVDTSGNDVVVKPSENCSTHVFTATNCFWEEFLDNLVVKAVEGGVSYLLTICY